MIEVVSAVIIFGGRLLMTQRSGLKDSPWAWECPGGRVESTESHRDALRREMQEELGIDVLRYTPSPEQVWSGEPIAGVRITFYRVHGWEVRYLMYEKVSSDPHPCEGQGIGWFDMRALDCVRPLLTPGNAAAFDAIFDALRRAS